MKNPLFYRKLKNIPKHDDVDSDLSSQLSSTNSARKSALSYHSCDSNGKVVKDNHADLLRKRYDEEVKRDKGEIEIEAKTIE